MKGILFKPAVWQGKLRALKEYGEAETRRLIKPQPQIGFTESDKSYHYHWQATKSTTIIGANEPDLSDLLL